MFGYIMIRITIVKVMIDLFRSIDVNRYIATAFGTNNRWCCIKRINSVVWTSEFSIWCIVSRTDIVFNIFPNNWIEFLVFIKLTTFWEDVIKKFFTWIFAIPWLITITSSRKILRTCGSESNSSFWCIFHFLYRSRGLINLWCQFILILVNSPFNFLLK